ncbi:MAG: alpha/beta fold hydrolase [Lysobacterales bacterium]
MKKVERAVTSEDGIKLSVTSCGDSTHPPVVLLHGGGQTGWSWRETALTLAEKQRYCLLPDLRGHGSSQFAENYQLDRFADDVGCIVDTLCHQPPVAVGASMGGLTALMAQSERPILSALILVDIVPDWKQAGIEQILGFLGAHPDGFASVEEAAAAIAAYLPHRPAPRDLDGLKRNLRRSEGRWFWHWDPRLLEAANEHVAQWQQRFSDACRTITIPTLLISGGRSEVVDDKGAENLKTLIPHAQHVEIKNARHMVAGDSNQQFTDAVLEFLDSLGSVDSSKEDSLCLVS